MTINRNADRMKHAINTEFEGPPSDHEISDHDIWRGDEGVGWGRWRRGRGKVILKGGGVSKRVSIASTRNLKFQLRKELRGAFREYVNMDVEDMGGFRERWGIRKTEERGVWEGTIELLPIVGLDLRPVVEFKVGKPGGGGGGEGEEGFGD